MACGSPSSSVTSDKKTAETNIQPAAKSDKPPLSELFKLAAGSWNCQGCYLINSGVNVYCVACDKPKDPSLPPKPQTNAFQLNASSTTTFSFGISKDSTKETTGFCFQVPKAEDKSAGDVFAMPSSQTEETGGFVFKPTKPMLNSGDARFTFSSPPKSYGFNFTARSPSKSPGGGGETNEEEVVESDDIHFSPVIPLPEKIDVKTGEEDEEILYTHRAKLFRFDVNVKEWKERGLGDIKLLRHKETDKLRLIMRRDHVLKLCLNHLLSAEIEFQVKDEKTWLWNAADYSEGEIEYMQFACRFKTSEIAEDFKRVIDNARKGIRSAIASNSEKVIKPATKTVESPPKEIEIVYELKVTSEEKAAALKLQLPENFYAYKQKKDCPGCRGCRRPSIVLYPDDATTKETTKVSEEKKTSELTNIATSKLVVPSATVTSSPSSNFQNIEAPSHVTQSTAKSEFSFAMAPTTTFASSSVFDGSAMSFGTGDLKLYNDKKSTTFSFGMNPQFAVNEMTEKTTAPDKQNVLSENLKICSPNIETAPATTSNITGQSIFSQTSTTSIFKTPTFTFDTTNNIFGGTSKITPKITIFGGSNSDGSSPFANTFNVTPTITTTNSVPITSTGATYGTGSLFGSMVMQPNSQANDTATITIPEQSRNPIFTGAVPFPNTTFSNNTSLFGDSPTITAITTSTTTNIFDTTPSDGTQKSDDTANFFSNATTFAALATKAAQPEAFKTDPNFSFAGAGSSVFGSKSNAESSNTPKNRSKTARENSKQKDNNEEDDGEVDNEQEYDPQFEPIVPLPDAIEIRTGEEDEEKVFCERAKLYRYSDKEWKERGVGEMKILHHAGFGSYRLLLRREQVYKVVCNFLLTPDVTFQPLAMSEQAWMWAGMNHAEGEANVEKLAVKFKSIQLAKEFKRHIDRIQLELRERSIQGERCVVGEVEESGQDQDDDEEKDEDDEEEVEEDEEEEDDEDDQEIVPIMEKRATVYARCPSEANWQRVGLGTLAIYYDSEIYAERIVFKLDNSEEYAINTIISMETVMQVEGKECIWSGIDYAFDPAVKRVLRAVFSSVQAAQEMYGFFEEGLNSAKQAGVVEYDEDTQ